MITWAWIIGAPVTITATGLAWRTHLLHRDGASWAGVIAYQRMRRRP